VAEAEETRRVSETRMFDGKEVTHTPMASDMSPSDVVRDPGTKVMFVADANATPTGSDLAGWGHVEFKAS
jgi:hypothetical protein